MNGKRLAAVICLILIALTYLAAFIAAFIHRPLAKSFLMAALFSTFVIPVMVYAWQLIIRHLKDYRKSQERQNGNDEDE